MIVFTPGFPGGNAGRFEQRYAKSFVDEGYAFLAIRHNGTALDKPETADEIINSPDRMKLAVSLGERYIGGEKDGGYRLTDVVKETVIPLIALHDKFNRVHLMGQSMGVASSYYALDRLKDNHDIIEKIGNVVGIAGYIGGNSEEEGIWDGMKMPAKDVIGYERSYIERVGTNAVITEEDMRAVAELNDDNDVPDHVGNILVFTPKDPLIAGPKGPEKDFICNYGPKTNRKLVISDESNLDAPKQHSMLWIKPENLLRAARARVSAHGPHYARVYGNQ